MRRTSSVYEEEGRISFRPRQLDITRPLEVVRRDLDEEDPAAAALSNAYRAVPAQPTGMEREEEAEKHIVRALRVAPGAMTETAAIPVPGVRVVPPVEAPGRTPPRYAPPAAYVRYAPPPPEALDAALEYDLTPSDSEWLAAGFGGGGGGRSAAAEDALELLIDRFEKAEARARTELTGDAAARMLAGERLLRGAPQPADAFVRAALDYYHAKRRRPPRRGEFLLDRLKPPPDPRDTNPFTAFRPRVEEERLQQQQKRRLTGAAAAGAMRSRARTNTAAADPDSPAGIRLRLTMLRKELAQARELAQLVMERELERARLLILTEQLLGTGQLATAASKAPQQQQQQQSIAALPLDRVRAHQRSVARSLLGHSDAVAASEYNDIDDDEDAMEDDSYVLLSGDEGDEVTRVPQGMTTKMVGVSFEEYVDHCRQKLQRSMARDGSSVVVSDPATSVFAQFFSEQAVSTATAPQAMEGIVEAMADGHVRLSEGGGGGGGRGPAFQGRARLGRGGRIVFERYSPSDPFFC